MRSESVAMRDPARAAPRVALGQVQQGCDDTRLDLRLDREPGIDLGDVAGIALAQIMPGPLAAQTAMAIGYFQSGVMGATLVGLAFILPSFVMVLGLSALYVAYGGMPWMQSVFYGIGALIITVASSHVPPCSAKSQIRSRSEKWVQPICSRRASPESRARSAARSG